jgi:hypothetical protein
VKKIEKNEAESPETPEIEPPHEDPSPEPEHVPPIQQPEPSPYPDPSTPVEPPHSPGSPVEPHPIDPSLLRRRYHQVPAVVFIARRAACARPWRGAA